jgi:competence protein ComEA
MSVKRSLWDFFDTADQTPVIIDTQDDELENDYFHPSTSTSVVRWKVAVTAGLGLAAGIIVIAVGAHMFRQPPPEPVVIASSEVEDLAAAGGGPAPTETVIVHVVGAVVAPGIITLPAHSRVADAIESAGGITEEARLESVNLARVLFDGEQIVVPRLSDPVVPSGSAPQSGPISLSRADSLTLQTLPRVGPATAERIISWREEHGPFGSVDDLLAISGIGPATLDGFRDLVVP